MGRCGAYTLPENFSETYRTIFKFTKFCSVYSSVQVLKIHLVFTVLNCNIYSESNSEINLILIN